MVEITSLYRPTIVKFPTGGRYVISGSTWIPVDDNVTMKDVKWTPIGENKKSNSSREWKVKGSKGNTYKVRYQKGFGWWCECLGFSFRKQCKHVTSLKEGK